MGFLSNVAGGFFKRGNKAWGAGLNKMIGGAAQGTKGWGLGSSMRGALLGSAGKAMGYGAAAGAVGGLLSPDGTMLGGAIQGAAMGYGARGIARGIYTGVRTNSLRGGISAGWKALKNPLIGRSALKSNDLGKSISGISARVKNARPYSAPPAGINLKNAPMFSKYWDRISKAGRASKFRNSINGGSLNAGVRTTANATRNAMARPTANRLPGLGNRLRRGRGRYGGFGGAFGGSI